MRSALSLALALAVLAAPSARAEIAVLASGKTMRIERFERHDERLTLFVEGGGEVTVPVELVRNIVPNEIVDEELDPAGAELLPHLRSVIAPAAAATDLDARLLAAVIWVESSGDPRAVSRKGARGLMQLMPETARRLGVRDPFDPGENVAAGARYLRRMLDRHGQDLRLALAAYNAGPAAVARHGGVPPYGETRRYVEKVLDLYARAGGPTGP